MKSKAGSSSIRNGRRENIPDGSTEKLGISEEDALEELFRLAEIGRTEQETSDSTRGKSGEFVPDPSLADRLRDYSLFERGDLIEIRDNCMEAADEIERLEAENNQLYEQLEQLHEQLAEATSEIEKLRDLWENSPSAAR